jgi:hypothetical protein
MRTEAQAIDLAADTHSYYNDPRVETPGRASEVAVPPDARALSTVSRIDYEGSGWAGAQLVERLAWVSGRSRARVPSPMPLDEEVEVSQ